MFETVFALFSAWNALLYVFAGGVVSGLGLLIVGYAVYLRFVERRYRGEIVGVRTDSPGATMYWPLVAYIDESGMRHEVVANAGTSLLGGRTPGTRLEIFADPANPRAVMLARDWWFLLAFGLLLAAFGTPFLAVGISMLRLNAATGFVALSFAFYLGFNLFRWLHPLLDARKAGGWAAAREAFAARQKSEKHTVAVSGADIAAAAAAQARNAKYVRPALVVIGACILLGGGLWFERQSDFLARAVAAHGTVLRNEESGNSGSDAAYHAVVAFTDRAGREIVFNDSVGTSPPMFSTGDKVTVLYAPQDSARAQIDRGIWNWLAPMLVAAVGALLVAAAGYGLLARRPSNPPQPATQSR